MVNCDDDIAVTNQTVKDDRLLIALLIVHRLGSIEAAAVHLNVSSVEVKKLINLLEDMVGASLIRRN